MNQSKKLRILSVMLGRGAGGLESVFIDHAQAFAKLGYQSDVLCHAKASALTRLAGRKDIGIYTTPSASVVSPLAWLGIIRVIQKVRPDIICLHGNRAISFCTSPIVKAFVRPFPKLMATTHNNRNKRFYRVDGIFSITQVLKDDLIHRFHIDTNKIFLCPNAAPVPQKLPVSKHKAPIRIGFLGRLEPVKGCDILLNACRTLKKEKRPFHLVVGGDGSERPQLEEFVKRNGLEKDVSFIGWTNDKARFFGQVDIMCIPSRSEALSLTLLESLSYAKPVVVSSCPGMMEVISPLSAGLSFPIGDEAKLTDCLRTLIQDPKMRDDLAKRARQTYERSYTQKAQMQNLDRGIKSLLHHAR